MKNPFSPLALLPFLAAPGLAQPVKMPPPKKAPVTVITNDEPVKVAVPQAIPVAQNADSYVPNAAQRNEKKAAANLKIAENGKALVPLVIATKASDETKKTAQDLLAFLERMTGAKFEIQTPDGKTASLAPFKRPAIAFALANAAVVEYAKTTRALPAEALPASGLVVGNTNEWQVPANLQSAFEMDGPFHGREAFAIRTDARRLLLLGASDRGFNHGMTRLLEEMGCRWFATGPNWEIVPEVKNLAFGLDITDRPSIGTRILAFMDGALDGKERDAQAKWHQRNYIGASFGSNVGHNWQVIAEAHNDTLVEHPEYFAEMMTPTGRQRMQPFYKDAKTGKTVVIGVHAKFELTNPAVRKMFVDYALNYFRTYPDADMVSLSPTDGGNFSISDESQKAGTVSDNVYGMVNEVARAVKKEFPGKMVGCYAYRETAAPPSFPLEDNVYIEIATLFNMTSIPTEKLLEMWPKVAKHVGVYRYFSYFDAGGSSFTGGPIGSVKWANDVVQTDYSRNVAALFAQSSNAFAMQMRGYLVATRLMWNPQADPDAILADFYDKAYGPAAEEMKRFHEQVSPESKKDLNLYSLGTAFRLMDAATKAAKGRPDVLARLGDLKMYLRWTHLQLILPTTPRVAPVLTAGAAPADYDTALYASPYEATYEKTMKTAAEMSSAYMAQYNMLRKHGGNGSVSQKLTNLKPREWDNVPAPSVEKIEADFQESLKQLPTRELPEIQYDLTDLVPVVFPPVSPALQFEPNRFHYMIPADKNKRREVYQLASPYYYLYSFKGEPVEVEIVGGVRNKGGMSPKWALLQPDGKGEWTTIDSGEIPSDQSVHSLSLKVPKKGTYAFQFNGMNSWGFVDTRLDKPATINARAAVDYYSPFIYVPKGTKEIWLSYNHANGGGDRKLLLPDGKDAIVMTSGIYTIPVPPGTDGQLWRFSRNSQFRWQQFFNIPNIAAGSPEALMVPREVAIKDGLKIREN